MIRFLIQSVVTLLANAVGLLAAAWLLDDFGVNSQGFITATLIFTLATIILGPLVVKIAVTSAPYLMGGIALVTTFIGLIITNSFTDGIQINGLSTWILASLIIWGFSLIANLLLPLLVFKKWLNNRQDNKQNPPVSVA